MPGVPAVNELMPFIITGIVTGSLYGLVGLGLVITYRTSGVFNLGHGAISAAAAFLFYTLHVSHGLPWPVAAVIVLVVFAVIVGCVMELVTRGLGDVPEAVVVVATVGVLLLGQGVIALIYGNATRELPEFLPTSGFTISGVNVTWSQVISFAVATVGVIGLYLFLRISRLGVAMRAVVDNPTLVALSGDSPPRVRRAAWSIGCAFAAMSGILLAPTLGLDAFLLSMIVVQAFGACAIGMFRSLPLTYLGGITVGVIASLSTKWFTDQPLNGIPPAVPFLVLLVVLLAVPASNLPKRRSSLRSLVPEVRPMRRRTAWLLTVAGLVPMLVVPHVVGTNLPIWTAGMVYVIVFASLALLVWGSGQISLCHAAFVAVGACAMGHLTTDAHVPWAVALVLAGLITMPVGALVAIPAIRLSGLYLALATLGFGILMQQVIFPTESMFGRGLRVSAPRPEFSYLDGTDDIQFYYVVLVVMVLSLATIALIGRSRLGRLTRALAETPTVLSTHGLAVNVTRVIVFSVSAFFAGIAGGLTVSQFGVASGVSYGPLQSLLFLAVLAVCGTRLLRSAMLAGLLIAVVPGYFTSFDIDRQLTAFGLVAVGAGIVIANRSLLTGFVSGQPAAAAGVQGSESWGTRRPPAPRQLPRPRPVRRHAREVVPS
jgi:branched-subunit amino acid ABC-type transport system permease component